MRPEDLIVLKGVIAVQKDRTQKLLSNIISPEKHKTVTEQSQERYTTDPTATLKSKLKLKINESHMLTTEPRDTELSARQTLNPRTDPRHDLPYSQVQQAQHASLVKTQQSHSNLKDTPGRSKAIP